ncbi:MAG: release factor glutamine methyltransferase [Planctomycetota bacterium]|nr:MAG: release factor glutamine methyltransferase [Planctomycetota bacterium]
MARAAGEADLPAGQRPAAAPGGGPWTVRAVLAAAAQALAHRGIAEARLDAEWLLAHALGLGRLDLYLQMDRPLTGPERARYRAAVRRRLAREPLAYITGSAAFYSLELQVDRSVLVPRPETELLVDRALEVLRARPPGAPPALAADVGTGSGAIAIALARFGGERLAEVHAIDLSAEALALARANVERHGLSGRVVLHQGDLVGPLAPWAGRLALLVSNPPYVAEHERSALPPEVLHEPPAALFAGPDGLAVIRRLLAAAPAVLAPGGTVLVEIGWRQGAAVLALARAAGLAEPRLHRDLEGHERVLEARRPA